jgi:hypothetical protein
MSQTKPAGLPPAAPKRVGLPFHGVCKDGKIGTKDYPQPNTGDTVLLQHTLSFAPNLPNGDGESWQQYALLSGSNYCLQTPGSNRQIGGRSIGDNEWVYCDSRYSWLLSFEFSKAGISQTIKVWLESCFGLFPEKAMTRRQLCEITYTPLTYTGANQSTTAAALARRFLLSHSKTGDKTIINVAAYTASSPLHSWTSSCLPYDVLRRAYGAYGIHNAFLITISGDGSIASGEVGGGISATIAPQRTAPEMIATSTSSSTTTGTWRALGTYGDCADDDVTDCGPDPCPDPPPAPGSYGPDHYFWAQHALVGDDGYSSPDIVSAAWSTTSASASVYRYLDTVKPDGTISYLEISVESTSNEEKNGQITGKVDITTRAKVYAEIYPVCAFGNLSYDEGTREYEYAGSSVYEETKTANASWLVTVSWCGAEQQLAYTRTASQPFSSTLTGAIPGAPWTWITETTGSATWNPGTDPVYECKEDGSTIQCADIIDVLVYRVTNGLIGVFEDGLDASSLLTLLGAKQAVAAIPAATEASLNPSTGAVEYSAGSAVCWV